VTLLVAVSLATRPLPRAHLAAYAPALGEEAASVEAASVEGVSVEGVSVEGVSVEAREP
jgi:hypothetical protein